MSHESKGLPRFATPEEVDAAATRRAVEVFRSFPNVYVPAEQVAGAGGIEKLSLTDWVRAGLLPKPEGSGGRGNKSRYPLYAVTCASFVKGQREMGFSLAEIRPQLTVKFGKKIVELLAEPRQSRNDARKNRLDDA
ncbi:MerR family transcriptional regulator [Nannocystis punicea]|uniref:HTH merR-type domain-containing protein n=1 Tax=Nannocystis punicea TaxID=2995304 RepID=A0ABY7GYF8_9BACT|nr:MerR family transcriptional regulator [Nannocystis poenicansa]WAS91854.1 hypothetical protein O0S08_37200 [Nannocystis poenicansa]